MTGGARPSSAAEPTGASSTSGRDRAVRGDAVIREARPEDAPAIHRVVEAAYRGTPAGSGTAWTTEEHLVGGERTSVAEITAMIESPHELMLVLERPAAPADGEGAGSAREARDARQTGGADASGVIGCCAVHGASTDTELPEFGMFAVDPGQQAGGLGRALLEEACRRTAQTGASHMEIRVLNSRPELRAWYERRGFTATGEVRPFPGDSAHLKVADLAMDVMVRPLGSSSPSTD